MTTALRTFEPTASLAMSQRERCAVQARVLVVAAVLPVARLVAHGGGPPF